MQSRGSHSLLYRSCTVCLAYLTIAIGPSATEVKTGFQKFYLINNSSTEQFLLLNDRVKNQGLTDSSKNRSKFLKNLSLNSKLSRRVDKARDLSKNTMSINLPKADEVELMEKKLRETDECDIVVLPGKSVELEQKPARSSRIRTERYSGPKDLTSLPIKIKQKKISKNFRFRPSKPKIKLVKKNMQREMGFRHPKGLAQKKKSNHLEESPINLRREKSKESINRDIYEDFGNKFLCDLT
ncbi:unnamed protein product [Moneuplotes crassus]|uniref:Uncharacterized protein n=1 Tax=Euplotes crassus TaxID=5936 RepID=A0AAD1UC57_EUPCR|nr:unnamed protein product [Moneuplotes crassus]